MDKYFYSCHYCGKDYIPKRRNFQKYCSNSCRTNAFLKRNKASGLSITSNPKNEIIKSEPTKIDKMSLSGIANAAVGALAVNLATDLFTNEENKPATKKDIQNLFKDLNERYHPILNIPYRYDGAKPFYDLETNCITYLK